MSKPTDAEVVELFEETALLGMKAVREFFLYQGDSPKYLSRAKIGAMTMGAYTRLRATRANEKALILAARRQHVQLPQANDVQVKHSA